MRGAPIVRYLLHWPCARIVHYCRTHGWHYEVFDLPEWLTAVIPAARLEQVTAEIAGEIECNLATLIEVCAYLFTASLAFPLDRDHTVIYLWATAQVLSRRRRVPSIESVFAFNTLASPNRSG